MFRLLAATLMLAALAACETADGVGRDVENAGEAIQEASE